MKLIKISDLHFKTILKNHDLDGGNLLNVSLSKLFDCLSDESNKFEVEIKVAALNKIYSTSIQYISPVVDKIKSKVSNKHKSFTDLQYSSLVDKIATVSWTSSTTGKIHTRCNLSFASKYIHFLSGYKIPIYDSYIWIVMIGYLKQNVNDNFSFSPPVNYISFYKVFNEFKQTFNLTDHSNYEIDKFLWQYCKNMLNEIMKEQNINLSSAKSLLKKRITKHSCI